MAQRIQFASIKVFKVRRNLSARNTFVKAWFANFLLLTHHIELCWRVHVAEVAWQGLLNGWSADAEKNGDDGRDRGDGDGDDSDKSWWDCLQPCVVGEDVCTDGGDEGDYPESKPKCKPCWYSGRNKGSAITFTQGSTGQCKE